MDSEEGVSGKDRPQVPRQMDEIFDFLILWFDTVDMLPWLTAGKCKGRKSF